VRCSRRVPLALCWCTLRTQLLVLFLSPRRRPVAIHGRPHADPAQTRTKVEPLACPNRPYVSPRATLLSSQSSAASASYRLALGATLPPFRGGPVQGIRIQRYATASSFLAYRRAHTVLCPGWYAGADHQSRYVVCCGFWSSSVVGLARDEVFPASGTAGPVSARRRTCALAPGRGWGGREIASLPLPALRREPAGSSPRGHERTATGGP
jgi:hypothetical protein